MACLSVCLCISQNVTLTLTQGSISQNMTLTDGHISQNITLTQGHISHNVILAQGRISQNVTFTQGCISQNVTLTQGHISQNVTSTQGRTHSFCQLSMCIIFSVFFTLKTWANALSVEGRVLIGYMGMVVCAFLTHPPTAAALLLLLPLLLSYSLLVTLP